MTTEGPPEYSIAIKATSQSFDEDSHDGFRTRTVEESYYRSDPDVIAVPTITTQPSMTSIYSGELWTYAPSGSVPLERSKNLNGSCTNVDAISCATKSHGRNSVAGKDSISAAPCGSRDWSRDLFEPFRDVKKSTNKCSALMKLLCQCIRVPCMMCDVSRSLGDPAWLPYIPGTGAALRFKVRILGGIQGTIADDCLLTSCCCPCAVCQMHTEIEDIGLGPS